jgi:myo-inositol-1(or 4)-monophosphatase
MTLTMFRSIPLGAFGHGVNQQGPSVTIERELLKGCEAAVRAGAAVLLERLGNVRTIDKKGVIDLVTDADRASEATVLSVLAERFPGTAVLAEESGARGAPGGLSFVVDPLDGTTNYAHGLPHFSVTVAALDGSGVLAGATLDPVRDELFLAARGGGASLNGAPIRPSACTVLSEALLVTGFPYDVHADHQRIVRLLAAFLTRAQGLRRLGSAALDLAWVACGRLDGYWETKLKPWDVAAGLLIAREAGAAVTDFAGGDRVIEKGEVVAAPAALHPRLLEVIAAAS